MQRLPLETQTIYAELLDRLTALAARRSIGQAPGSFVAKKIKGQSYWYFQHAEPGGVDIAPPPSPCPSSIFSSSTRCAARSSTAGAFS